MGNSLDVENGSEFIEKTCSIIRPGRKWGNPKRPAGLFYSAGLLVFVILHKQFEKIGLKFSSSVNYFFQCDV